MSLLKAIFFDFGNTLVFPELETVLAPLRLRGVVPTEAQLLAAERTARQEMDLLAGRSKRVDQQYWETYYSHLLGELGLRAEISLRLELVANSRKSGNWKRVLPGTTEVLEELKKEYRLGIISNSDGQVRDAVAACGLAGYFETVTDSGSVGVEKPKPEIFHAGCSSLGVKLSESLYVGDIYSIDYLGATGAGMKGLLFDRCGAYAAMPLPRIESLKDLKSKVLVISMV